MIFPCLWYRHRRLWHGRGGCRKRRADFAPPRCVSCPLSQSPTARYEGLFEKEYPVESGNVENTFEAAAVVGLDVELGGCLLEITEASQNIIKVETENIGKFQAYLKEGKLYLKATRKAKEDASGCSIKLYLPAGYYYQEMELTVGAGQIWADHLNANKVHLEVGAGQIMVDSVSADELEVSAGAGDIDLKQMTTGFLEADVDAGRLQAIGQVSGDIEGECAVGSLELNLSGFLKDYNYLLDCAAGNIYLDGEKYSSAIGQERKIDHGANRTMDLDCAVGNIRIVFGKEE